MIAFGWRRFLNGSAVDPRWLMRLPMTKAGVNAMTAIQLYAQNFANVPPISDFIVCGASKRGWNTWTIAAVGERFFFCFVSLVLYFLFRCFFLFYFYFL